MVKHGDLSRAHVCDMVRSTDARVRRAAFILLEASNPTLRRDAALFMEIVQFIWHLGTSEAKHGITLRLARSERRKSSLSAPSSVPSVPESNDCR